jgi:2-(1,2-epoxy-1,2-dihydrophenyl)acetyl-CoA isomerase
MEIKKSADPVTLLIRDKIAEIRFNRPTRLNAIDLEMARGLRSVLQEIRESAQIRVVVLRGSGRGFVAGGDLSYFHKADRNAPAAARRLLQTMHEAIQMLGELSCPVVASVRGPVAGAGMSLSMIADLCIATSSSTFNLAYAKIGNSPDCGASWTLPRLVGSRKAMEMALLCDTVGAAEAHRLGIVNFIVPDDELDARTDSLAERIASLAPLAVSAIKRQINASFQQSLKAQLDIELTSFVRNAGSRDFLEGVAAFLQKREAVFEGH